MSTIHEIRELRFDGDYLVVDAVVEDTRLVHAATETDPAEYGPGLCRGTLYFSDDVLIPATDADLLRMLGERIDDWVLCPTDADYEEVCDD